MPLARGWHGPARPPNQNTDGNRLRGTLARAMLKGVRLRNLRHFFASGRTSRLCSRALGQARSTITQTGHAQLWLTAEGRARRLSARRRRGPRFLRVQRAGEALTVSDLRL